MTNIIINSKVECRSANLNAPKNNLSLGFELSVAAYIVSLVGLRIVNLFSDDDPLSIATDNILIQQALVIHTFITVITYNHVTQTFALYEQMAIHIKNPIPNTEQMMELLVSLDRQTVLLLWEVVFGFLRINDYTFV